MLEYWGGTAQSAAYLVYAAALGTPGGNADMTTCAVDKDTGLEVCSTQNVVLIRNSSKPKWSNVTNQLTTLTCTSATCGNLCAGTCTFELFNSAFQDFLWDYDNNGLKNAQIRFYLQ